jgi:hypothetical protein
MVYQVCGFADCCNRYRGVYRQPDIKPLCFKCRHFEEIPQRKDDKPIEKSNDQWLASIDLQSPLPFAFFVQALLYGVSFLHDHGENMNTGCFVLSLFLQQCWIYFMHGFVKSVACAPFDEKNDLFYCIHISDIYGNAALKVMFPEWLSSAFGCVYL